MSFSSLIFKVLPFRPLDVLGLSAAPLVSGKVSEVSLTGADARLELFTIRKTELLDFGEVCCAEVSTASAIIKVYSAWRRTKAQKKYMFDLMYCQYFS